jgi:hypothetical protein
MTDRASNAYRHEQSATPRTRRMLVEVRDRTPDENQPSLFDPPEGARPDASNRERWETFRDANWLTWQRIRELALAEAARGARRISVNRLFEQVRAEGVARGDPESEWALNNNYRAPCADDLCQDTRLAGLIERRARRLT